MMRYAVLLMACVGPSAGQIVETMQDYAAIGKRYAEWAATAAPTDDETLRNVLAAGAQGSAGGASSGCPGCSFIEVDSQAPVAEIRSESKDMLKKIKVNVAKEQEIPQELISFVEEYEKKRNEQEQSLLGAALHSKSSFLGRSKLPFELRIGAGSKRFPNFYAAVRDMENSRRASEAKIRDELVSMWAKKDSPSTFLAKEDSPKALAESIAQLQKKVYENPAFGETVLAEFARQGKQSNFLRRPTPEINVKYEFPVSDLVAAPKSTVSFAEIDKRLKEQSGIFAKLNASVQHSQFLRNGAQYDRKTQAPIVWLHLNDARSSFLEQAVTPNIDLYLEQSPSSQ